ncbi:TetR/AcrR family transcriptional regulator [Streptoalloteichus hindustanus]|uniref:Transcriptional regulator, TetR family n=1 Tax=Streptoalloteichus hindustanus TaxID=2017 RepID=A0A1M5G8W0_STRHI|nr:TetR/AcrR family transcriptional regulator [Streptoalloteichus hindustanus]SHF99891.1 transcriptional regulator, TetR family [Streptoalloteichus hindustanus]
MTDDATADCCAGAPREGGRRRGRQAEAELNDQRVLEAARDVFACEGADAPVSAVAKRAGVGMGSLYRRYGSKVELIQHLCQLSMEQAVLAAEEALASTEDPWAAFVEFVHRCVRARYGALSPVAGTIPVSEAMDRTYRRSRELLQELVQRTQAEGGLRPDVNTVDISRLIELFGRSFGSRCRNTADEQVQLRLLALALAGLRVTDGDPLPGPKPSLEDYENRWYLS